MIASIIRVSMTTLALWENPSYECPPRRRAKDTLVLRHQSPITLTALAFLDSARKLRGAQGAFVGRDLILGEPRVAGPKQQGVAFRQAW